MGRAAARTVCDLDDNAIINVTQLVTADRRALETPLGALPDWLMALVDDGLRRAPAL